MTGTKITMSGADTAHYRDATAITSRLVWFPDGVQRHIALTNRQWEVFDNWPGQVGQRHPRLAERTIELVQEMATRFGRPAHYEREIRLCLAALIRAGMQHCSAYPRDRMNDNNTGYTD
jgi:hypothetical protein